MTSFILPALSAGLGSVTSLLGAGKESDAAKKAEEGTQQAGAQAQQFTQGVYNTTLAQTAPYTAAGTTAINNLATETAPGGSLTQGFTQPFSFTGVDLLNDPAYQFDQQQGQQAAQRSAAAAGGLVSGGALKDLSNYAQGTASNQFQQSYQNALTNYQTAFNVFNSNQQNSFARQAQVAGMGQTAIGQNAQAGSSASGVNAQTALTTANQLSDLYTSGASAQAAGLVGAGNSLRSGVNQISNALAQQSQSSYGGGDGGGD